jgi:hypothetical protein
MKLKSSAGLATNQKPHQILAYGAFRRQATPSHSNSVSTIRYAAKKAVHASENAGKLDKFENVKMCEALEVAM